MSSTPNYDDCLPMARNYLQMILRPDKALQAADETAVGRTRILGRSSRIPWGAWPEKVRLPGQNEEFSGKNSHPRESVEFRADLPISCTRGLG